MVVKIKTSKTLDELISTLENIDFLYVDSILSHKTIYYTIFDKTTADDGFAAGAKLATKYKDSSVYKVSYCTGYAYFVGNLNDVKLILKKALKDARKYHNVK